MKPGGMGSHESSNMGKDEWLTPPFIMEALGAFDLDPCSPINRPWDTANNHLTVDDDGLNSEWNGRVWCNPPYGKATGAWLNKLAKHGRGTALIFARTETKTFFQHVWAKAHGVLFIKGRLCFHHVNGERAQANAGAPSALVAYGIDDSITLRTSGINGYFVNIE